MRNWKFNVNPRGFTLLELMVVIAITGILSTIAVVQFNDAQKTSAVRHEAENFAGYIRETENRSRVGMPMPNTATNTCADGRTTAVPCGGYGVEVQSNQYFRFGNTVNPSANTYTTSDPEWDTATLPTNITISTSVSSGPSSSLPYTLLFVPPKDIFCINATCGPANKVEIVFTFKYSGLDYQKSVRVNTVSGLVSVE